MDTTTLTLLGAMITLSGIFTSVMIHMLRAAERRSIERHEQSERRFDQSELRTGERFDQSEKLAAERYEQMERRSGEVNQRFERMEKHSDRRFDQVDQRFDHLTGLVVGLAKDVGEVKGRTEATARIEELPARPERIASGE